jgi:hypothetical protein
MQFGSESNYKHIGNYNLGHIMFVRQLSQAR